MNSTQIMISKIKHEAGLGIFQTIQGKKKTPLLRGHYMLQVLISI